MTLPRQRVRLKRGGLGAIEVKIAPYQGTLGIAALGLGGWCIAASLLLRV